MKKSFLLLITVTLVFLSGCSLLEETTHSLNYANEASDYINTLSNFAEETSSLEGQALLSHLESLKGTIEDFMTIDPPTIATDIHQELENKSQVLLDTTNNIIDSGETAVEQLKQSDLYQTIENITDLKNQIEALDQ
ncbi:MAG: DUF6376 family protein [Bacillota bacterium]|uniref:DUF6376 family protein n=1 Tax=Virgibacillus sp. AGTR TaxID=2812055 RepID=UPI00196247BA|nr:DUF6376 family protein [Virgibacillus sp. AGTR]MCC2252186.1 DUF6376 family protein [Virgibacillus sp. AGTR]QRZ16336.1 hypothetical protein JUJ52_10880 [Virgibacillus sp. AGTR]